MKKEAIRQLLYDVKKVLISNPGLAAKYVDEIPTELFGNFVIKDHAGAIQGDFDIMVKIPAAYPIGFPTLYETSKKITRIDDRHIDENGGCCVEITQKILSIARNGISLQDFFKKYVHRFFCWQLVYEEDPLILAQWDHRECGVKQFYKELFGSDDKTVSRSFIESVLNRQIPRRKDLCLCGSGKFIKKCHRDVFYELEQIGVKQLLEDLKLFLYNEGTIDNEKYLL